MVNTIIDKIIDGSMAMAAVIIVADALAVSADVLLKNTMGKTWNGLFEVMEYSILWMTFLGTAWILKKKTHIVVDAAVARLSPKYKTIANIVGYSISLILIGIVIVFSIKMTIYDFQSHITIPKELNLLKWPVEAIIPFGSILFFIELSRDLYRQLIDLKGKKEVVQIQ
jgi:TRAP-type C4-dicarboxylate transport system permease small subunit